MTTKKGLFSKS